MKKHIHIIYLCTKKWNLLEMDLLLTHGYFFVFCFLYSDYKFYVKMLVGWKFYDSPDKLFGLESLRFDKSLW